MIHSLTPEQIAQSKLEIANYKQVMTQFGVPASRFFGTLAISRRELDLFFGGNPGITGMRIYLSKKTNDPSLDDYGLSFVPCLELEDSYDNVYYQDRLEIAPGEPGKIIMGACRIPPGCPFGGEMNP